MLHVTQMMAYDKRVMRVSEFLRERCWGLTLERERKRKRESARSRTILRKRRKRTAHEKKNETKEEKMKK